MRNKVHTTYLLEREIFRTIDVEKNETYMHKKPSSRTLTLTHTPWFLVR
jgi:hypothetical protein